MVVEAHEQAHYKTALWCVYTSYLDSGTFRKKPLHDSLWVTLQKLIAFPRTIQSISKGPQETLFRFNWDFHGRASERLFNNVYLYAPTYWHLSPVVAVWVNNKDGLIDSVTNGNNITAWPGPQMELVQGRWKKSGPVDRKKFSYNLDQPCKTAF